MRRKALPFLLLPLLLLGCSLDYHTASQSGQQAAQTPDTILYRFTTTSVRGEQPYFRITAAESETFNKKNLTTMQNVSFQEFDSQGKVIAYGSADRAVYHNDTRNAVLSGHIEVYSQQEQAKITTDYLSWNNKSKTLTGKPAVAVTILKDNGSRIEAKGFGADLRTRTIRFSSDVRGTFVDTKTK